MSRVRGFVAVLSAMLIVYAGPASAQQAPPPPAPPQQQVPSTPILPGFGPRANPSAPVQPPAAQPKPAETQGQAQAPAASPVAASPGMVSLPLGGLTLQNVSLVEVIDFLARQLKLNYVLDKRVQGSVTVNTYGEVKDMDKRALLDTLLRINGFGMVKAGDIWRIVPLADLAMLPMRPEQEDKNIPEDDRPMLNLVFLKYANVEELSKLIDQFKGDQARIWTYAPANLLLVLDSRRNIRRLMELVALFDSDVLAHQRVRIFDTENSRPSDLAKELESLLKSLSLGKDLTMVKFIPVDRINALIAVAPNPGVFNEVENWLKKLDVKQRATTGTTDNYVYRVKYGYAPMLAMAIMQVYSGLYGGGYAPMMAMMGMMGMGMGGGGMMNGMYGMGGMGMGGMGMGGYGMGGMGMGGYGMGGMGMGGYGMGGMGMGGYGMGGMGMGGYGMGGYGYGGAMGQTQITGSGPVNTAPPGATVPGSGDMTGQYLGMNYGGMGMGGWGGYKGPRVVPNYYDNTLIIQGSPQEYDSVLKLLRDIDVPPRQVLIEAKIYQVDLSGSLSNGVEAYLQTKGGTALKHILTGAMNSGGVNLTAGMFIGRSRELLAQMTFGDISTKTKVVSAPAIIATDSIPASINVGLEVPVLQSQAVGSVVSNGSSQFTNTVSYRSTGVQLSVTARVNPSGIVTLVINQELSTPQAPSSTGVQSSSFAQRKLQTQVTMQDGDTIAIGGIIAEDMGLASSGVPGLNRIPILGSLFGNQKYSKGRSEIIVFMTPRVIYDTNDLMDASDELKAKLRKLKNVVVE